MYQNVYRIRRAFLIPLSIDVILLFLLLLLSLFLKGSSLERTVLIVIFIPVLYIFLESAIRRVSTGEQGMMINKFLRKKELGWEDITHLGAVGLRKKVYLLLTTVKGFHILSNAYENFPHLVRDIVGHLDEGKIDEEARRQIDHPVKNISDIISAWVAALVLGGIITAKVFTP